MDLMISVLAADVPLWAWRWPRVLSSSLFVGRHGVGRHDSWRRLRACAGRILSVGAAAAKSTDAARFSGFYAPRGLSSGGGSDCGGRERRALFDGEASARGVGPFSDSVD